MGSVMFRHTIPLALALGLLLQPAFSAEPVAKSTAVVVEGTRLTFDPRTCTEGGGGFAWGLGSLSVKIVGRKDKDCVFDYRWEVEGAGNYQVERVSVPIDSVSVSFDAHRDGKATN